ncbi:MAG TPA: hypothetical protein VF585_02630, partial [Chthoniobacterales bacterium]
MKKRKLLKFLLWLFVSLITLVALLYAWTDWSGNRAWRKVEAELLAKGEPLRLEQIIPPHIADEKNFASSSFLKGVFEMDPTTDYRPKYPQAVARFEAAVNLPRRPSPPQDDPSTHGAAWHLSKWQTYFRAHPEFRVNGPAMNPAEDIMEALANAKVPLDHIARELRERPQMRVPRNYDDELATKFPTREMGNLAKFYELRAIAQIRLGKAGEAYRDLESLLLLRKVVEPRLMLTGNALANGINRYALSVLREGLAARRWDEDQLTRLSLMLELQSPLPDLSVALRADRVFFVDSTRRLRGWESPDGPGDGLFPRMKNFVDVKLLNRPQGYWAYDRSMYSRLIQQLLEKVLKPKQGSIDVSALHDYAAELDKIQTFPTRALLSTTAYPNLSRLVLRSAEASTYSSVARIAIAVERYHAKNSSLPENLGVLVPEFIAKIPHDPIDGKPLRYQKLSTT